MKNKTAMQEFSEWLLAYEYELPLELQIKAKECLLNEKEQIIEFANKVLENADGDYDGDVILLKPIEEIYNETYNSATK
jgi:hypothetical protein